MATSVQAAPAPSPPSLVGLDGARTAVVVDLGSNSWRLVAYRYVPGGWWREVGRLQEPVRIVAGVGRSGRLRTAAIARGLATLDLFARCCRAHGIAPEAADVVATSAIRDAPNGVELIERARATSGVRIRVLSAAEEARYGYLAAVNSTTLTDGLVLDLGGGSLQLVAVEDRLPARLGSWPLGAVRVSERLLPGGGPPSRKELRRAREDLRRELERTEWLGACGPRAAAIGGSARNLAAAAQHGGALDAGDLGRLVARLAKLPARRRALPGIKPARADIILGAALVLEAVLDVAGLDAYEVSPAGLREGVFFAGHLHAGGDPLVADVRRAGVRNVASQHDADLRHAERVSELAVHLHDGLPIAPEPGERELLWAAAMLHDVGLTIGYDGHPGHSEYIVRRAWLPGFAAREVDLVGQIVRQYRRADAADGMVARCALLVRLADCLDSAEPGAGGRAGISVAGKSAILRVAPDDRLARWTLARQVDGQVLRRVLRLRLDLDNHI